MRSVLVGEAYAFVECFDAAFSLKIDILKIIGKRYIKDPNRL